MDTHAQYHENRNRLYTIRLRTMLKELPPFCATFFRGIADTTAVTTRLHYAFDLRTFFQFLIEEVLSNTSTIKEITLEDLDTLEATHLEIFMEYLSYYEMNDRERQNHAHGKERKLVSLRSFFRYLYKRDMLTKNVAEKVDLPKKTEKPIIRLEPDEIERLISIAETGAGLGKRELKYHTFTVNRDVAILVLLLGTGIRISECVGLNVLHINFRDNSFIVTRKGGDQEILYFGEEVMDALQRYLVSRENIIPLEGHEDALFLSMQRKRLGVRAIEIMVKKYSQLATPLKRITPHKLRSTFGTSLYRRTGDIYLVANVLGHADVNTTKRHYAAINEDARRLAAQQVTLRGKRDEEE